MQSKLTFAFSSKLRSVSVHMTCMQTLLEVNLLQKLKPEDKSKVMLFNVISSHVLYGCMHYSHVAADQLRGIFLESSFKAE
jgi:hypothetical protein